MDHLDHPEDALVEVDPLLHVAELDVADDVVDRQQHVVASGDAGSATAWKPGQKRALVAGAVDEGVEGVAVGGDRRGANRSVLVA